MHYNYVVYLDDASYEVGDVVVLNDIKYVVLKQQLVHDDSVEWELGSEDPPPTIMKKIAHCHGHCFVKFSTEISASEYPRKVIYEGNNLWRLSTDSDSTFDAILTPQFETLPQGNLGRIFLQIRV